MTKVINFFAGPGAGKTTLAAKLFGYMKELRYNVEYVPEFAKDLVWDRDFDTLNDQLYVSIVQHHWQYRLLDQVDYIITDSPLLLGIHYMEYGNKKFKYSEQWKLCFYELIHDTFRMYDNINFFVDRKDRKYIHAGRNETEEQSIEIDNDILTLLQEYHYNTISTFDNVLNQLKIEEVLHD